MEAATIIAGAAGVAGLGIGLGTAVRLVPVYLGASHELKEFESTARAAVDDDIETLARERQRLGYPAGRKRDASIVGVYDGALRHSN